MAPQKLNAANIPEGVPIQFEGDVTIHGTIRKGTVITVKNGTLTADALEDNVMITASGGGIHFNSAGNGLTLSARDNITFTQAGNYPTIKTGGDITFKTIGDGVSAMHTKLEGKNITGETVGKTAFITAKNGNIDLGDVGTTAHLNARGNITFRHAENFLTAESGGTIQFDVIDPASTAFGNKLKANRVIGGAIGDYGSVTASVGDISIHDVASFVTLNASGSIYLDKGGKYIDVKAGETVGFGTLEGGAQSVQVAIAGKNIKGDNAGPYISFSAKGGDIRIKTTDAGSICMAMQGEVHIGTVGKNAIAHAGKAIYHETPDADQNFRAPVVEQRPWRDITFPKPKNLASNTPDTNVNERAIIDQLSRDALDDGIGI